MSTFDLNDPRLTAYALNEMDPAEKTEFEKILSQYAAARKAVEEIRATVAELSLALAHEEPVAGAAVTDFSAEATRPGSDPYELGSRQGILRDELRKSVRFPRVYYMISGLAAACFAVFFVYWQKDHPAYQAKHYVQMPVSEPLPKAELAVPVDEVTADADGKKSKAESASASVALVQAPAGSGQSIATEAEKFPAVPPLEKEPLKEFPSTSGVVSGGAAGATNTYGAVAPGPSTRNRFSNAGYSVPRQTGDFEALVSKQRANTESYSFREDNAYVRVADQPLSTFSADVDTASYANVRRFLSGGRRPPVDAVRIEELVNYFPYRYAPPVDSTPFATSLEVAEAPWATAHRLVRIGIKAREITDASRPAANLVFLLDVSGSMNAPNRLPLVKESLRLLVAKLRPDDRVAIAVYAGASGLALPSTPASHRAEILEAIDRLEAAGSTNGAEGIQLAYDVAKANFITGGVNRVILATDGDFNVGITSQGELVRLIGEKAKSGVFLSVLGFGMGNLKDSTLEQLADKGNGNYAYIDSLQEAKKTLVEQAGGTLVTVAKDLKLQVEFNPAQVQAYRLIGYENRLLAKEDFNNDQVDAGEIGAGHTVTALYEVVPVGVKFEAAPDVDPLKYAIVSAPPSDGNSPAAGSEMLTVKIRYKEPAGEVSSKLEFPLRDIGARFEAASHDFKFAAAVAAFGLVLRDSPHKGTATLVDVLAWAHAGLGDDPGGYRNEFVGLVERAIHLAEQGGAN